MPAIRAQCRSGVESARFGPHGVSLGPVEENEKAPVQKSPDFPVAAQENSRRFVTTNEGPTRWFDTRTLHGITFLIPALILLSTDNGSVEITADCRLMAIAFATLFQRNNIFQVAV